MLRRLGLTAAAVLLAGCATAPVGPDVDDGAGPITLRFQSLAFQEPSVAATERIVTAWNAEHPDVQVQLTQGTWDAVHDQLVTQFQGGTAPDVIHDESADIAGFARQGYLADLGPHLSGETRSGVPQGVWDAVTVDGKVVAAPTLLQSYVVFANTTVLEQAGVTIPTSPTWTWDELADAARRTTSPERAGLGWGLRQPTATVMSLGLGFGGRFFTGSGDTAAVQVGDAELEVPRRIHEMAYTDRSLDPTSLTQSGSDVITGFLAGRYAMVVAGSYVAQQLAEAAPPGFAWRVLPALAGTSPNQAANPQTLSVPADSPHVEQAAEFIEFVMRPDNVAALAQGEWLIPASQPARDAVEAATGGQNGWEPTLDGAQYLTTAPFQAVADYPQWKDQIATPALQRYLGNQSDLPTLQRELTEGWAQVAGG
ncbi:ABC transporter substrate-binding protein [Pseudonocardia cypriaca]|uniref:Carbohydrate ABC transporter substrate-binding protein (CUT1 family) n=1 Tax=Pseudonocardia cypriaca TaxID=882449 RepID=A0A543FVM5_9PSEU|nr:sugar ABC transporter substrate-binding protein [Pseudonocardia cypriaca]TQM37897.1 carbohydrate ABC transporter substrate-binding protein (CUT1 family) [Pseudonocardia cypriaca]